MACSPSDIALLLVTPFQHNPFRLLHNRKITLGTL